MNKFAATISVCVQIGIDHWKQYHYTRVFYESESVSNVLAWAKTFGKITINDIVFSEINE